MSPWHLALRNHICVLNRLPTNDAPMRRHCCSNTTATWTISDVTTRYRICTATLCPRIATMLGWSYTFFWGQLWAVLFRPNCYYGRGVIFDGDTKNLGSYVIPVARYNRHVAGKGHAVLKPTTNFTVLSKSSEGRPRIEEPGDSKQKWLLIFLHG